MRTAIVVSVALLFAALTALAASQTTASSDPCEGYGDCLSASLTYLRANPDNSLYLGDSFQISLAISYGPNTVGSQTSWAYDTAAFSANTTSSQAEFRTLVNGSSAYAISASVTFTVVICTTSNGVTTCVDYYPTLSVQETVQTRAFELQLTTEMSNFTDSQGYLLRNPDGSFFHDDEFYVNYTYGFLFMQQRPDIRVVVEPQFDPSFVKLTAYQNSSSTGYFLFTVGNRTGTSEITMTAKAFNYREDLLGSKNAETAFRRRQLRSLLHLFHVHGVQLKERERLRKAVRHARPVRREQPGLFVRRRCEHRAHRRRQRHRREGPDQLVQLHDDGLGRQREPHLGRHQPRPIVLEPDLR